MQSLDSSEQLFVNSLWDREHRYTCSSLVKENARLRTLAQKLSDKLLKLVGFLKLTVYGTEAMMIHFFDTCFVSVWCVHYRAVLPKDLRPGTY